MLGNTYACLQNEKKLTIGYFGGSITEGAGASNKAETSWRAQVTKWFTDTFKDCEISEINAAIGGTGTDLGAYRCQRDLLKGSPDLVFVEFAVNDYNRDSEQTKRNMEGIIRQILKKNPSVDIILVYTISKVMYEQDYQNNCYPESVFIHQKLADYYHLPSINIGEVLIHSVENDQKSWEDLLPDTVHPNDTAYQLYAEAMIDFLKENITEAEKRNEMLPPLNKSCVENGILADAWEAAGTWEKEDISLCGRYPHRRSSNQVGEELTFTFSGTDIGVYWVVAPDSGDIEWKLDDGAWQRKSSWDKYALQFERACYAILATQLPEGEHQLTIRISKDKEELSTGHWVRIGAFLVNTL